MLFVVRISRRRRRRQQRRRRCVQPHLYLYIYTNAKLPQNIIHASDNHRVTLKCVSAQRSSLHVYLSEFFKLVFWLYVAK